MAEEEPWELYYWPGFRGRGQFIRLMFEECEIPWVEVYKSVPTEGFKIISKFLLN